MCVDQSYAFHTRPNYSISRLLCTIPCIPWFLNKETGGWTIDGEMEEAGIRAPLQHLRNQHEKLQIRYSQHLQGKNCSPSRCLEQHQYALTYSHLHLTKFMLMRYMRRSPSEPIYGQQVDADKTSLNPFPIMARGQWSYHYGRQQMSSPPPSAKRVSVYNSVHNSIRIPAHIFLNVSRCQSSILLPEQ